MSLMLATKPGLPFFQRMLSAGLSPPALQIGLHCHFFSGTNYLWNIFSTTFGSPDFIAMHLPTHDSSLLQRHKLTATGDVVLSKLAPGCRYPGLQPPSKPCFIQTQRSPQRDPCSSYICLSTHHSSLNKPGEHCQAPWPWPRKEQSCLSF